MEYYGNLCFEFKQTKLAQKYLATQESISNKQSLLNGLVSELARFRVLYFQPCIFAIIMSLVYITHHDENILGCEQEFEKAQGPKESIFVYKNRKDI